MASTTQKGQIQSAAVELTTCPACGTPTTAIQAKEEISTTRRANRLAEELPANPPVEDAVEQGDTQGWTCPRCRALVSHERRTCQVCGAQSAAIQSPVDSILAPPTPAGGLDESDLDVENLEQRIADGLAARAFRAAVVACILLTPAFIAGSLFWTVIFSIPGALAYFYSCWSLLRLALLPRELSSFALPRSWLTLFINLPLFVAFVWRLNHRFF
jgi:hypothetical protein